MTRILLALVACSCAWIAAQAADSASGLRCSDEPRAAPEVDPASDPAAVGDYTLRLDYKGALGVVAPEFLSVTFDANSITFNFDRMPWTSDPGLVEMASELQPMYLRFGGQEADWLYYAVDQTADPTPDQISAWSAEILARNPLATSHPAEILSFSGFQNFTTFLRSVGWKLVFGLNLLDRSTEDGSWNATNSLRIIDLVASDPALRELVVAWELGNEPDLYNRSMLIVEGGQIAKDTAVLRSLIPPEHFVLGWDVSVPWLQNLWPEILRAYRDLPSDTVRASTLHHYYRQGNNSAMQAVLDPDVLDELRTFYDNATAIAAAEGFAPPLWLGETSSFSGGGFAGVSDRFAAGFLWLDKLGLAAKMGVAMVFRQTLRSNEDSLPPMSYGLLSSNILPHADYWNSLLHKRLMGQQVLDLELSVDASAAATGATDARKVRAYAHCTSTAPSVTLPAGSVQPGAVTFLFLNLETDQAVTLDVAPALQAQLGSQRIDFRLQASTIGATWEDTLASIHVNLNGQTLLSMCNGSIPLIHGLAVSANAPFTLPQLSMFFMVFPEAQMSECGYVAPPPAASHTEEGSEQIALE